MSFSEGLAGQLARPSGLAGRILGAAMDVANREPVRVALELLDTKPGMRVLDAGCGTGEALQQLVRCVRCDATGIDPSAEMIAAARRKLGTKVRLVCAPIEAVPGTASYDGILALNVLYFCRDDGGMLTALHRMLAPGGKLVAYVSHRDAMERWAFTRAGLHRLFDEGQLASAFVDAGFAPDAIKVHSGRVARGVTGLWASATV